MTARHKAHWAQEVDIMLRLDHENVVKCMPVPVGLDQGSQDLPSLCMEYCESGDLRRVLNKPENCRGLPEGQILLLLRDVSAAIGYLHNRRIIHRDLKPENVVLKSTESRIIFKLIDLGYAKELGASSLAKSFVGTLQYVAPELFLEKDYTKSVDYWSLGLICYEIITGCRPFLPHLSPGQWVDHVQSKDRKHIAIVEGIEGDIQLKDRIGLESRVARPLAERLEEWLRCLLEWNPETRGKHQINGQIVVFSQLEKIIRLRSIRIFNMTTRSLVHFVEEPFSLDFQHLQQFISSQLGIPEGDQLYLTEDGYRLTAEDQLVQFAAAEFPIFLVDTRRINLTMAEQLKQVELRIPNLVQHFLRDVKKKLIDYHHKMMYIHGYHFISQENQKNQLFAIGLRGLNSYVINESEELYCNPLDLHFTRVKSKLDFHNISLEQDLARYEEQAQSRDRITSNKMIENWRQSKADLVKIVDTIHSRISMLEENKRSFLGAIKVLKMESLISSTDKILQECASRSLQLYDNLRRERASTRVDNTARGMAQLVVRMLRRRDELLNNSCQRLVDLRQLLVDVHDLKAGNVGIVKACEKVEGNILRSQNRRQSDIWTLVSVAIKYTPQSSQNAKRFEEYNNLDADNEICFDTSAAESIIKENVDLRKGLEARMNNLDSLFSAEANIS